MDTTTAKSDRLLRIYARLQQGEILHKAELAQQFHVTQRSIQRDVGSLRCFLADQHIREEILFDRKAEGYRLCHTSLLSNSEILAVCKILLESRSMRRDEMLPILDKLISGCVPEQSKKAVSTLIANEKFHYIEPHHGKPLLNGLWEIGQAVQNHHRMEITYARMKEPKLVTRLIEPVGIMFSEYYFYLTAFLLDDNKKKAFDYDYDLSPTIYRLDRIQSFRVLQEHFAVPYSDRFEEGEFRKRVQFMYGGKLERVRFWYSGSSLEAVLDRLPSAEVKEESEDGWLVEAEVFGRGIEMWLRMDADELRKFARLEAIQDKFEAYPQFWYYFAHTASYLSQSKDLGLDNESKAFYSQEAIRLFAKFMELNRFNILREDHIAATAALEYADIRLLNNAASDDVKRKVAQDLDACIGMAGNSNDLLQMFAIAYLRCGATDRAANVLKNLVNEDYNAVTNAKILSRLYAVQYLASDDDEGHRIHTQYQTLMLRVNPNCLFPLPTEKCSDEVLTQRYITAQKALLIREYRHAITAYAANRGKKYDILLQNMGQQGNIVVGSLNDTVASMDHLALFCKSKEKEKLLEYIRADIYKQRGDLKNARKVPFESLTKLFFEETIKQLAEEINALPTVRDLEQCYLGLVHFCQSVNIELPNSEHTGRYSNPQPIGSAEILYLDDRKLLSDQYKTDTQKLKRERVRNIIGLYKYSLIKSGSTGAVLLMPGDKAFTAYFEERNAQQWEPETLMVLVDTTEKHCDLLLTYGGYILIERNRVGALIPYEDALSGKNDSNDYLELHWPDIYDNQGVDLRSLSNLLVSLCKNR